MVKLATSTSTNEATVLHRVTPWIDRWSIGLCDNDWLSHTKIEIESFFEDNANGVNRTAAK